MLAAWEQREQAKLRSPGQRAEGASGPGAQGLHAESRRGIRIGRRERRAPEADRGSGRLRHFAETAAGRGADHRPARDGFIRSPNFRAAAGATVRWASARKAKAAAAQPEKGTSSSPPSPSTADTVANDQVNLHKLERIARRHGNVVGREIPARRLSRSAQRERLVAGSCGDRPGASHGDVSPSR